MTECKCGSNAAKGLGCICLKTNQVLTLGTHVVPPVEKHTPVGYGVAGAYSPDQISAPQALPPGFFMLDGKPFDMNVPLAEGMMPARLVKAALPTDYAARKALPLWTYLMEYFPDAFVEVVKVAVAGDKQHANEGKKIRWAREKSTDQMNTAFRHMFDYGRGTEIDTDGCHHLAKAIWRLSAELQLSIERKQ